MKTTVLSIIVILIMAAGCNKDNSNTARDKFTGNYTMNDTAVDYSGTVSHSNYIMTVSPLSGSSNQVVFYNIAGRSHQDTAIVSSNVATFTNGYYGAQGGFQYNTSAATASLSGNRITLAGGEEYSLMGSYTYRSGVGTKQ